MAIDTFDCPYALIVNLDAYTGNFERKFCAYVMGAVGECGVGKDMRALFLRESPMQYNELADLTQPVPDERGCWRPVSIYDDPSDAEPYNSLVIFLGSQPSDEELEIIVERARKFCAERPDWKESHGPKRVLTLRALKLISNKVVRTQELIKTVIPV